MDPDRPSRHSNAEGTSFADRGLMEEEIPKKDPRKENFLEMMYLGLCPTLTFMSLCTIVVLINIVCFIVQVSVDGINKGGDLLEISTSGRLVGAFSVMFSPIRHNWQYYRLLTSLFLHGNFLHVFNNCLSTIIWGPMVETLIGTKKMAVIYFISGFMGNLFSLIFMPDYGMGVGASTSIFSFFGTLIGFLALNYHKLPVHGYSQKKVAINIALILGLNIIMLATNKKADNWAHFGGLIGGACLSLFLAELPEEPKTEPTAYEKRIKLLGILLSFVFPAICFAVILAK